MNHHHNLCSLPFLISLSSLHRQADLQYAKTDPVKDPADGKFCFPARLHWHVHILLGDALHDLVDVRGLRTDVPRSFSPGCRAGGSIPTREQIPDEEIQALSYHERLRLGLVVRDRFRRRDGRFRVRVARELADQRRSVVAMADVFFVESEQGGTGECAEGERGKGSSEHDADDDREKSFA